MGPSLARLFECLVEQWIVVEETQPEANSRGEKRVFALIRQKQAGQPNTQSFTNRFNSNTSGDRYDYESKYSEDPEGEGMAPNARVWRVYLDEAGHFDADMVENIRDTVDVILVFVGLFSAIVSTLVSQASTALQPDFSEITAALLMELVALQRAMVAGTVVGIVSPSTLNLESPFIPSSPDRWVNGLWFVSLAFSLSTALLAVLIKQWIQAYVAPTFGTPHFQSRVRHFRYMGMEEWHVPLIAGMLPILLHLSLFLFFVGLIVLLFTLDHTIAGFVTVIGSLAYFAYLGTNLLPVWYSQCPYKTPLSRYIYVTVRTFKPTARKCWISLQRLSKPATSLIHSLYTVARRACHKQLHQTNSALLVLSDLYFAESKDIGTNLLTQGEERLSEPAPSTLQLAERASVDAGGHNLDAHILSWLCDMSSNPSVGMITVAAVSDLPIAFPVLPNLRNSVLPHACHGLDACLQKGFVIKPGMEKRAYVYLHAHMQLGPDTPVPSSSIFTTSRRKRLAKDTAFCHCSLELTPLRASGSLLDQQPHFEIFNFLSKQDRVVWLYTRAQYPDPDITPWPVQALTAHELRRLLKITTSKRSWVLLLQRGLLEGKESSDPAFDSEHDEATLQHFLAFIHQTLGDFDRGDPFHVMKNVLLSAYLCQWTRPQDTTPEHHHLLRAAIEVERQTFNRENLERCTRRWYSDPDFGRYNMDDVLRYYQARIVIHMLLRYARSSSPERGTLLRAASLFGREGSFLPMLADEVIYRRAGRTPIIPPSHPIMEKLRNLIPTPVHMQQLLQDGQDLPDQRTIFAISDTIAQITTFLSLTLEPSLVMSVIQANDPLGAFHIFIQAFPSDRQDQRRHPQIHQAVWAIIWSASSCPNPHDYLVYVRSHLNHICAWILSDVAHLAIECLPGPLPRLQDIWTPSFDSLRVTAEFIAEHTSLSEYESMWNEAIQNLPTSCLREEHKAYIELCTSWMRPRLAEIWTAVEEDRIKAQDKTPVALSLWSKAQSAVRSVLPSFIKRGRQPSAGEDVRTGMPEIAQEGARRSSEEISRANTSENRFEEV